MTRVFTVIKFLLSQPAYFLVFILLDLTFFSLLVLIPLKTIPGNSLTYQLAIFTTKDYLLLSTVSTLAGLLLTMNAYLLIKRVNGRSVAGNSLGISSGVIAGIFGTATCSSCLAALLGFLGLPTILLLLSARWYITVVSVIILLVALWWTARRVDKTCRSCEIRS